MACGAYRSIFISYLFKNNNFYFLFSFMCVCIFVEILFQSQFISNHLLSEILCIFDSNNKNNSYISQNKSQIFLAFYF